jgi:hypothetical protein
MNNYQYSTLAMLLSIILMKMNEGSIQAMLWAFAATVNLILSAIYIFQELYE